MVGTNSSTAASTSMCNDPPHTLRLGISQSATQPTLVATLAALAHAAAQAAAQAIDVLLFPESYLGGYPRGATFGSTIGARDERGRDQFLLYWRQSVDLGDTPRGEAERWVRRGIGSGEGPGVAEGEGKVRRGDGTREELESVARETGVFLVVGLVERAGGTLYCGVVYVCPRLGVIGKRRKVMPTGSECLIWGQGQPSSLRAVTTTIRGVNLTLAAAVCWENYMPLLRHTLYSQNVNLYLAPTADGRDTWLSLMRTVACEGRCFVMSANQCVKKEDLPEWIHGGKRDEGEREGLSKTHTRKTSVVTEGGNEIIVPLSKEKRDMSDEALLGGGKSHGRNRSVVIEDGHEIVLSRFPKKADLGNDPAFTGLQKLEPFESKPSPSEFVSRGGSCIISPFGEVLAGPLWENDNDLLVADVDFEDCLRGRLDLDVAGSHSRNDAFKLTVEGLDMSPPV